MSDSAKPGEQEVIQRLLGRLKEQTGTEVPSSTLGRLRRTASAAFRVGAGVLGNRLRGNTTVDQEMVEQIVLSLGELKGIAMKIGQILSYVDTSLSEEARQQLSILQVRSQAVAFSEIEAALRQDFGARADQLLAGLEREPVASASIGQVHRGRLPDGTPVAVKVRHPNIETAIKADFRGAQTGKLLVRLLAPGADIDELVAEAEARFLEECDYGAERRNQERFCAIYAQHSSLAIPSVHGEWCSGRILTTTWRQGLGFEAFLAQADQAARDRAGRALYEFYIGTLYGHGLFNADPHPGNLLFEKDGGVIVLDHGCVREFDAGSVKTLARLSRAVRDDDASAIRRCLMELGAKDPGTGSAFEVTRTLLRGFFSPLLQPGARRLQADVNFEAQTVFQNKRSMLKLHIPGRLLFLFRIRFGLHSVLARLGAELDWRSLEAGLADPLTAP